MDLESHNNSEVKHDVYDKRQTAKLKLSPSPFSCVYSRVKLFVFAMNSRRRCSISVCFIYGLEEKNSKSEVIFAVCRLPLTSCLTSLISSSLNPAYLHSGYTPNRSQYIPLRSFSASRVVSGLKTNDISTIVP